MPFTDQTSTFVNNGLLTHQQMDVMADNDRFFEDFKTNLVTFSAYHSTTQSIPNPTAGKISFDSEEWDSHSAFNTSLSRFVAPVAGKYFISCLLQEFDLQTISSEAWLYKNGSVFLNADRFMRSYNTGGGEAWTAIDTLGYGPGAILATVVDLALSDFLEIYAFHTLGGQVYQPGPIVTYFQGYLLQKTP